MNIQRHLDAQRAQPVLTAHDVDEDHGMEMLCRVFVAGAAIAIVLSASYLAWQVWS